MNKFPLLLALRYLYDAPQKKSISTMVIISFISICIGSFALMLTLAIMHGFEVVTCEQLQTIHSQLEIRAFGNDINIQALQPIIKEEFPEISAYSPSATQQVLIQNPHTDDISTIVAIKGIDPETASRVNNLTQKICSINKHTPSLQTLLHDNHILIGKKLAESLELSVGDTVTLLFSPDEPKRKKISLSQHTVTISGFFSTGIEEFDIGLIFSSLELIQELFPHTGITQLQIRLHPHVDEQKTINKLRHRLQLEVYSWKELYPALVAALKLEKYVMFLILALISLIASMNIISLIFMHMYQKRSNIAILRAYGMSRFAISMIFFYIGGFIALIACATGITLATLCALWLETYPYFLLPDAYFVTHLPAKVELFHIIVVFVCCMLLSLIGIWIPLRRTEEIDIADVLRNT